MTNEVNRQSRHLSSAGESLWVVRHEDVMLSCHRKSKDAARWLNSHIGEQSVADAVVNGYRITRSYTAEARYIGRETIRSLPAEEFEPEWTREFGSFGDATDGLSGWVQKIWGQDIENHPSVAGREQVHARWHDVVALLRIADLTMLPNPAFQYNLGPLSPPEGKGYNLRLLIVPTSEYELKKVVRHHV